MNILYPTKENEVQKIQKPFTKTTPSRNFYRYEFEKSRGRQACHLRAGNFSAQNQNYSAGNLAVLQHAMGYLKHAYNAAYAEGKFSDDLADTDDFVEENLAVLQLAIKHYSTHTV